MDKQESQPSGKGTKSPALPVSTSQWGQRAGPSRSSSPVRCRCAVNTCHMGHMAVHDAWSYHPHATRERGRQIKQDNMATASTPHARLLMTAGEYVYPEVDKGAELPWPEFSTVQEISRVSGGCCAGTVSVKGLPPLGPACSEPTPPSMTSMQQAFLP